MNTKDHYDKHLGDIYSWMTGDYETQVAANLDFFRSRIPVDNNRIAFDLGCGNGIQSVALAQMGYRVYSFDFNRQLLSEVQLHKKGYDITTVESDVKNFDKHISLNPDLIVCMGDTITHLDSRDEIELLLRKCHASLNGEGCLVLSFRDLSVPLTGTDRFIPVKSDQDRIMTCFLEYFSDHVIVHDLVHEKQGDKWTQKISSYKKVIISGNQMNDMLAASGFKVLSSEVINRMVYVVAGKIAGA